MRTLTLVADSNFSEKLHLFLLNVNPMLGQGPEWFPTAKEKERYT